MPKVTHNRSVIEIMVLAFTFIVGVVMIMTAVMVCVIKINDPEANVDRAINVLYTAITIIIGALLGMLTVQGAGRKELDRRPDEKRAIDITDRAD